LKRFIVRSVRAILAVKELIPFILFKMLVLQQLSNLSDEEVEFQVNDRRSFEEFVGLSVMNDIPDVITVTFYSARLRKTKVIDELFEMFESYRRDQGELATRWME